MTRPEPAGAGTAEEIARQLDATIHADAAEYHANFRRLVDAAITAAESRAMERCAKIARDRLDDIGRTIEADFTGDSWGRLAAQRQIVGEIMAAIRSSINPPGDT